MKAATRPRTNIGAVYGMQGEFGATADQPFYLVQLDLRTLPELRALLEKASDQHGRRWVTITASYHDSTRLRVTQTPPPAYEQRAVEDYLRGDVLRVTGVEGNSINLDLSSRFGVGTFLKLLDSASQRAKEFVAIRVPSRKHDLIELLPDVELFQAETAEQVGLGIAGAAMASAVLPVEDFADWVSGEKQHA